MLLSQKVTLDALHAYVSGGRHFQLSSLPNFFTATNSKDRQTIDGESSAECRAFFLGLLAEH